VPPGTLRSWEQRYGVPAPARADSGHRRYDAASVALVLEVQRHRAAGLSMASAAEHALAAAGRREESVFAGVRRLHPELRTQLLRKQPVLALSRAIEDECCAQADQPLLFASFQRERYYRSAEPRWRELSRTARTAVVFADFPEAPSPAVGATADAPVEVSVPFRAPLNREWVLVCDSVDYPGCVVGWERPAPDTPQAVDQTTQRAPAQSARRFETFWSVEPRVVRDAARICAGLVGAYSPSGRTDWPELWDTPPEASSATRRASGVLDRMLGYLAGQD
jgi:DICT domain-containing protein